MTTSQEVYNRAYAHFGNHELAREASEMYPGDFITEDDEDDYGYDDEYCCDNCRDAGCSLCNPSPDCSNCDDRGCERCDPEAFPPEEPRCVDCDSVAVDNAGDVCSYCQEWRDEAAKPRCCSCSEVHTDSELSDGDICRECDDYWRNHYKSYYRWYKRLWRRVTHRQ